MTSQQEEEDSILQGIDRTRELWSSKADGDISYLTPKAIVDMSSHKQPMENGVNGHSIPEDIVRSEDQVEDEFDLPDVKSMKSRWEQKPKSDEHKHKKAPKHKTALDRPQPPPVPVNREENNEEKEEEYEVEMRKLKEHFEMEAKRSTNVEVKMRNKPIGRDSINKRVSVNRRHGKNHPAVNGTSTTTNKRFEEEIKIANSCEVSHEKDDLPTVELSSLKNRFESNKDEKVITPETTGVPKRQARGVSMSSDTSSSVSTEIVRSEDKVVDKIEVEVNSLRQRFEQKMKEETIHTSKPVEIERQPRKSTSSESSNEPAPQSADVVRSSEPIYDEMVGEESVKDRLARYKEMTNKPTEIKHKVSIKRKTSTPPKQEKVVEEEIEKSEIEIVRSPPAGTKEKAEYTASVDLTEAKALFGDKSPARRGSRHSTSSSNKSPVRSRSSRSSTSSPSPSRSGASSRNSSRHEVVVLEQNEVKRVSTTSESEDMSIVRPPPAGSKEVADYSPSVDLRSVRSMFENPSATPPKKERPVPAKRPIVVERKRSDSSSPERNPEIVRSSEAGQKEVVDYDFSKDKLNQVKSMFSSDGPKPTEPKPKPRESVSSNDDEHADIVRSSVAKEEPTYELSIDLRATRSMFDSPQRPEQYQPRNTITRTESQKKREAAEIVPTSEAGAKEVPEYKLDLKTKKQLFEEGIKEQAESSPSSSDSESDGENEDLVKSSRAGKREVADVKPSEDIKNVTKMFENNEVKKDEEEAVEEKLEQEEAELSSSSESETESEGEVELSQQEEVNVIKEEEEPQEVEDKYEEKEVVEETRKSRSESLSSESTQSEGEDIEEAQQEVEEQQEYEEKKEEEVLISDNKEQEEPAAAVVPVRVAITEPLADETDKVEQVVDTPSEPEQSEPQKVEDNHENNSDHAQESSSSSEDEKGEEEAGLSSQSSAGDKEQQSMSSSSDEENNYLN